MSVRASRSASIIFTPPAHFPSDKLKWSNGRGNVLNINYYAADTVTYAAKIVHVY